MADPVTFPFTTPSPTFTETLTALPPELISPIFESIPTFLLVNLSLVSKKVCSLVMTDCPTRLQLARHAFIFRHHLEAILNKPHLQLLDIHLAFHDVKKANDLLSRIDNPLSKMDGELAIAAFEMENYPDQAKERGLQKMKARFAEYRDTPSEFRKRKLPQIVKIQVALGDFSGAKETAGLLGPYQGPPLLNAIAAAQAKSELPEEARQTWSEAKEASFAILEVYHRAKMLEAIAIEEIRAGFSSQAKGTISRIPLLRRSEIVTNAIKLLIELRLISEAKGIVELIEGDLLQKCGAWAVIAEAEFKKGEDPRQSLDQAKGLAKEIKDPENRCYALSKIAAIEFKFDRIEAKKTLDSATACLNLVRDLPTKAAMLKQLATIPGQSTEEMEELLTQVRSIMVDFENFEDKVIELCKIAELFATTERTKAKETLLLAKAAAEQVDMEWRSNRLEDIAVAQAKIGDADGAKATYLEAIAASQKQSPDSRLLRMLQIAKQQAKSNAEGAKQTLVLAKGSVIYPDRLIRIANVQLGIKDVEGARKTFTEIKRLVQKMNEKARIPLLLSMVQVMIKFDEDPDSF